MSARALIVVDVQNDFCEGGSLAVTGGADVAAAIAAHVRENREKAVRPEDGGTYAHVVATADWHIDPGEHFSQTPDFVDSWPRHCEVGTPGADFHPRLAPALGSVEAIFRKGEFTAAYSGFEGEAARGVGRVGLAEWLRERGVDEVDVVGIATDHCVRATALDAAAEGFATRVLLDLTAGVGPQSTRAALDEMRAAGVEVVEGGPAAAGA